MGIRLVVNADDLGVRADVDAGILAAHAHGVVTSASLLVTGPSFAALAPSLRGHSLGLGVHLALSGDLPTAAPADTVRTLLDPRTGRLPRKWPVAARRWLLGTLDLSEVRREWEAQLARAFDAGLTVDHVDSHEHVHAFPGLWEQTVAAAATFGIRRVRRPVEPPLVSGRGVGQLKRAAIGLATRLAERRRGGQVVTTVDCHGIAVTGALDVAALKSVIDALGPGDHELCCHPGGFDGADPHDGPMDRAWLQGREAEKSALCDPEVREWLHFRNVSLVRWADVGA